MRVPSLAVKQNAPTSCDWPGLAPVSNFALPAFLQRTFAFSQTEPHQTIMTPSPPTAAVFDLNNCKCEKRNSGEM